MKARWFLAAVALSSSVVFGACASSGGGGAAKVNESSSDKVTSIEITQTQAQSAYDLVYKLRPHWLRAGAVGSIGGGTTNRTQVTLVYLDGNKLGTIEALRTISASGIRRMEFLSASRASVVLSDVGNEPIAGAIALYTR